MPPKTVRRETPGSPSFDDAIAAILVEKNYLSKEEIDDYIKTSKTKKKRLGTLLLENNVISRRDLYSMILAQMKNKDLPTVLVEEKFISFEELTRVFLLKKGDIRKLGRYLVSSGILSEKNLAMSLSKVFGVPYLAPEKLKVVKDIPAGIGGEFFGTFLTVMTKYSEKAGEIEFAICDPSTIGDIMNSNIFPDFKITFVLTTFGAVTGAIDAMFPKNPKSYKFEEFSNIEVDEAISDFSNRRLSKLPSNFPEKLLSVISDNKNSMVRPLFEILYDAARAGATEVHFESFADGLHILLKMNGQYFNLTHHIKQQSYDYMVAKIKHLCRMNFQEDRMYSEGGFTVGILSLKLYVDAVIVPALFGENMFLKLCPLNGFPGPLESVMKYQKKYVQPLRKALGTKGSGIIAFTGTDSFALHKLHYTVMNEVSKNLLNRKAISIERDIAWPINGITQIEYSTDAPAITANPNLGPAYETAIVTGAGVVASPMIHDMAAFEHILKAVATGALTVANFGEPDLRHLLYRIVTSPDAKDIVPELRFVAAARTANFICPFCREEDRDRSVEKGFKVFHGKGCSKCNFTGSGEQALIFEALEISAKEQKALAAAIKAPAKLEGLVYDTFEVTANEFYKEGLI